VRDLTNGLSERSRGEPDASREGKGAAEAHADAAPEAVAEGSLAPRDRLAAPGVVSAQGLMPWGQQLRLVLDV
jgi:hypothetical protein